MIRLTGNYPLGVKNSFYGGINYAESNDCFVSDTYLCLCPGM